MALKQAVSKSVCHFLDRLTPFSISNALSIVKEELFEGRKLPSQRKRPEESKESRAKKPQAAGALPTPQMKGAFIPQNADSGDSAEISQLNQLHLGHQLKLSPNHQVDNHPEALVNPLKQINQIPDFSFFACSGWIPLRDTDVIWSEFKPIILRIIELLPLESSEVERTICPFIGRFIAWSLELPASECYHHYERGGLVRHSLETALLSLQYAQDVAADLGLSPKEQRESATIFMLLAFAGGLLHDAGKVLSDLVVVAGVGARAQREADFPESEESLWNPITFSLMEFLDQRKADSYFFRYRPGRGKNHETMAQIMADRIIPDAFMSLILRDTHGVCELFGALTCNDKGRLYQIIKKADIASVLADLGSRRFGMSHQGRMPGAFERFILIIQDRLRRESDLINTRDGWLFIIGNEVYLSLNTHVYLELLRPLMRAGLTPSFRDRTGFYEALVNRGIGGRRDSILKRVVSSFMVAIGDELYLKHGCLIVKPEYFLGDAVRPAPLPLVHPEIYRAFTLIAGKEHISLPDPTLVPAGVMLESQISVSRISGVSGGATDKPERASSDFSEGCVNREQGNANANASASVSASVITSNEKDAASVTFTDECDATDGIKITECLKLLARQGIVLENPFGVPQEGILGNEYPLDKSDQMAPTTSEAENDRKDKKDDVETGFQFQHQSQSPWAFYAHWGFGSWKYSLNSWHGDLKHSNRILKSCEAWSIPVDMSVFASSSRERYFPPDCCVLEVQARWTFKELKHDAAKDILITTVIIFGTQGENRYDSINYSFRDAGDSCDAIDCTCNNFREVIAPFVVIADLAEIKSDDRKAIGRRPDNSCVQNKEAKQRDNVIFNVNVNVNDQVLEKNKNEVNKSRQGEKGKLVDNSPRVDKPLRGDKKVADAQRPDKKRFSIFDVRFDAKRKASLARGSVGAVDRALGLGVAYLSSTGIADKNRAEMQDHIKTHILNHIQNKEQNALPNQERNIDKKETTQVTIGEESLQRLNGKGSSAVDILRNMHNCRSSPSCGTTTCDKAINKSLKHPSGFFKIPGYVGGVQDILDGGQKQPPQALFYEPFRRRSKAQSRPKEAFLSAGVTPKSRLPQDFWLNIPVASEDKDESACADAGSGTGAKKISVQKNRATAGTTEKKARSKSKNTTASIIDINTDETSNETNNEPNSETRLEFEIKSKPKTKFKPKPVLELSELIDNPLQLTPAPLPRKRDARGRFISSKVSA